MGELKHLEEKLQESAEWFHESWNLSDWKLSEILECFKVLYGDDLYEGFVTALTGLSVLDSIRASRAVILIRHAIRMASLGMRDEKDSKQYHAQRVIHIAKRLPRVLQSLSTNERIEQCFVKTCLYYLDGDPSYSGGRFPEYQTFGSGIDSFIKYLKFVHDCAIHGR